VSFLPGLGVIMKMACVGEGVVLGLLEYGVPYGEWIGVGIGAIAVFIAFAAVYTRFDSVYGN
jgi:tellurite resistance protein TehA-like permease